MQSAWVIGPVINYRGVRMPKAGHVEDMGQPIQQWNIYDPITSVIIGSEMRRQYLNYSGAIGAQAWCLTRVSGLDLSGIDLDNDFEVIASGSDDMTLSPTSLGWSRAKQTKFRSALSAKGVKTLEVSNSLRVDTMLDSLGKILMPTFKSDTARTI